MYACLGDPEMENVVTCNRKPSGPHALAIVMPHYGVSLIGIGSGALQKTN